MMMSCFGGCGYYRRRRLALLSHSPGSSPTGHSPSISPSHTGGCRRGHERHGRQFNLFAYNGPGNVGMYPIPQYHQPPLVASMPPAYAEVRYKLFFKTSICFKMMRVIYNPCIILRRFSVALVKENC